MYVTAQEYEALSLTHAVPAEELESALQAAERDIDLSLIHILCTPVLAMGGRYRNTPRTG